MAISGIHGEQPAFDYSQSLPAPVSLPPAEPLEGPFAKAMHGLGQQIDIGEAQVSAASTLRNYDTTTLIALQAGIYRYTEAVDLASKIVDRATNAVKTVLQGSH